MVVTDITEFDKKRAKIYLDGEFSFLLYKGEIKDYCIRVGEELSDMIYADITTVLLPKRAKLRAMNLLQKKDYTERQLRDKLSEGMYPGECINEAIEYVKSYRYLDDERYARDYITYHMSMRSKNRIIQDLTGKGIDRDILLPIVEELYSDDDGDAEYDQVRALLLKKHYDPQTCDFKEKQKLIAFLMRRGFGMSLIKRAMDDNYS